MSSFVCTDLSANADSAEGTTDDTTEEITIIVTATSQASELINASNSISLVSDKELALIGHVHINQALSSVPGTWISRGNGQEHLTAIRSPVLTGAGACGAFFMAEDGISLRAPGFCNLNQLFDANTEQAERLEVVRGPGSVFYGSNAVHGIINIISPDLFDQPQDYLGLENGPDDYLRGRFRFSNTELDHKFAVYGNFASDGGFQEDSGFDQQKLNLKHQYRSESFSVKSLLSATNLNQETAGFIRGINAFKDPELRRSNPNPEAFRDSQSFRAYSKLNWNLSDETQLSVTPYMRYTDMTFIQHFVPWKPIENNGHQSLGINSLYSVKEETFSWHLGLDWDYTQGELTEVQAEPFSSSIPQGPHYGYEVTSLNVSPFVNVSWNILPDIELNAGIRFDHIKYDYDNQLSDGSACEEEVVNCRFFRVEDQTRRFNNFSPRISLLYQVNQQTTLYSEVTQGFRAPHTSELFRLQAGQVSADLKTEKLDSFQIGLRGRLEQLRFDLSVYQMKKRNFIFRDTQRQVLGNGKTSHQGIELALRYPFSKQWEGSFSATHANHNYDNNLFLSSTNIKNNQIDTAPKKMANVKLNWVASQNSTWEMEWLYLGEYFLNPENSASYPGHTLIHLRGYVNLTDKIQLSIRLHNLADKKYAERADFAFGNYRYFVGQPRSLFIGFQYQLN